MHSATSVPQRTPTKSSRPVKQRHRSASDPFSDPVHTPPHQNYIDDRHPRTAPLSAPQPPPKPSRSYKHNSVDIRDPRMLEAAVRDTVQTRPVDQPHRTRVGRSQTTYVNPFLNYSCDLYYILQWNPFDKHRQ